MPSRFLTKDEFVFSDLSNITVQGQSVVSIIAQNSILDDTTNKIKAELDEVIVTTGSQEALFTTLLTSLDINEQVIICNPGYMAYIPGIELVDAVPIDLELKEEENFEINPDRIKKLINKNKKH